jgi:AcrR family transcriptional regulator
MATKLLSRSERQAQTYEALLDAAQTVFSQRGFHGASVAEIALAAGYTKGAVYANFAGKTELFLAVLDRHIGQVTTSPATTDEHFRREWGLLAFEAILYAVREDEQLLGELAKRYRQVDQINAGHLEPASGQPSGSDDLAIAWSALGEGLMLRHLVEPDRVTHKVIERIFYQLFGTTAATPSGLDVKTP